MNHVIVTVGLLTVLLNINTHAMEKEITYLFADKDTQACNDHYPRVQIVKSVFYHLAVHALQSHSIDQDAKSELLKKIHYNKIDLEQQDIYVEMTNKDAYHRLLRSIPTNGAMRNDGHNKIYPVLVNDVSSTLVFRSAKLKSILPDDDDGICTCISSSELCGSDDIMKRFQELTAEQPLLIGFKDNNAIY